MYHIFFSCCILCLTNYHDLYIFILCIYCRYVVTTYQDDDIDWRYKNLKKADPKRKTSVFKAIKKYFNPTAEVIHQRKGTGVGGKTLTYEAHFQTEIPDTANREDQYLTYDIHLTDRIEKVIIMLKHNLIIIWF